MVATLSHFALYSDLPFAEFRRWFAGSGLLVTPSEQAVTEWMCTHPWNGPVKGQLGKLSVARATVHAVIHLLTHTTSLRESMLQAIRWGGDVDSVMAITWGIQSARIHEPLPDWLETDLEDGEYGRRYLKHLGAQLMVKYA